MSLRSIALAGAAALAVSATPSLAAPIQVIEMTLQYVGTTFNHLYVFDNQDDEIPYYFFDTLDAADDPWGIPFVANGLTPGQVTTFRLSATKDSDGFTKILTCDLPGVGCEYFVDNAYAPRVTSSGVDMIAWETVGISASAGGLDLNEWYEDPQGFVTRDGRLIGAQWGYTKSEFAALSYSYTVIPDVPEVPVPATMALLPGGLLVLAALRRRRG
ncbi:PEP-CTERM sorting domain-containing protein [Paenirhodobacter sp.]|uniref:PEP-CTERM sorting domain-containing protein n=1 Tax=Paenirhodobacter sp. TaxID=1965326 RepID=UPI003B3E86F6